MRLSRYVVTYRDVRRGEHVLYDVIADRYVGVDDSGLEAIARWSSGEPAAGEAEAAAALSEMEFVVAGDAQDRERLEVALRRGAQGKPGAAYVTLMPTLACDLACTYCIQKDHPAQGHMKPEVEAAALDWIVREVAGCGAERLVVVYLGGEPLTRKDFVLRTAAALAAAMRSRGIGFGWQVITNGLSLDVPFARAMAAIGPGSVKVTLDGDRDTHDGARVYRDGRGSFDRIFTAMAAVARECPEVKVRVGGNFRPGQEASYERLLDRMVREGLAGRLDGVRFKPVVEMGGCGTACGSSGAETLVRLGRATASRGLAPETQGGIEEIAPCELHWDRAWTIDPAGRLYKCLAVAGRPDLALGDVVSGITAADPLTAGRPWEACGDDCPFVPVCLGGCLGGRVAAGGRLGELACDRAQLERRFRDEITRRYLDEFHPDDDEEAPPQSPDVVHVAA